MLRSLYTAATGMEAQQVKMDVIAHNLANTSTTGFKRNRAEFEDLLSETMRSAGAPTAQGGSPPSALQVGLGVRTVATTKSFGQGDMLATNNPLDVAIQGSGFFRVQQASGEFAYTRAGNFRVDATGRIVTQDGDVVQPGITVPQEATAAGRGAGVRPGVGGGVARSLGGRGAGLVPDFYPAGTNQRGPAARATLPHPNDGSGRFAVKLAGPGCRGWAWLRVEVIAPV